MACLRAERFEAEPCRKLSKAYLECRMSKCVAPFRHASYVAPDEGGATQRGDATRRRHDEPTER